MSPFSLKAIVVLQVLLFILLSSALHDANFLFVYLK